MKIIITILALITGGYMLLDGVFVMLKGKYIGPEKPGPWANIFYKFDINVYKLGPLFIIYGLVWLAWLYGLWTNQNRAYIFGLILCVLTLWYLPIGTLLALIIFVTLLTAKQKL